MELKVFCKQESVKQMQEIINMNINELVQCWRLATDKTECQASGEDELLQATDGFPEGLGTQLSAGPFPKVLQMHVLEEGKPGGGGRGGPSAKEAGSGCRRHWEGAGDPSSLASAATEKTDSHFFLGPRRHAGLRAGSPAVTPQPPQGRRLPSLLDSPLLSRRLLLPPWETARFKS